MLGWKPEIAVKNHESDPSISCEVDPSFVPKNQDHLEGKNWERGIRTKSVKLAKFRIVISFSEHSSDSVPPQKEDYQLLKQLLSFSIRIEFIAS